MMQSSPFNFRRALILLSRLVLGGILLYAGYAKIAMPTMHSRPPIGVALSFFALQVDSYQVLPPGGVNFVARILVRFRRPRDPRIAQADVPTAARERHEDRATMLVELLFRGVAGSAARAKDLRASGIAHGQAGKSAVRAWALRAQHHVFRGARGARQREQQRAGCETQATIPGCRHRGPAPFIP